MSGKRVLALYGALLFCFAAVVCRLYWLCSDTAYGARAAAQSVVTLHLPPGGAIFMITGASSSRGRPPAGWPSACPGRAAMPACSPTPMPPVRRRSTRSGTPRPRSCWRWTGMFPRWAFPAGRRHGEALPPRWQCSCWGTLMARAMVLPVWKPPLTNCSPAAGRGIPCSAPSTPRESCGPSLPSPPPTAGPWGCS